MNSLNDTRSCCSESDEDAQKCAKLIADLNLKSHSESDSDETDKNVTKQMLSKDIIRLSFNFVENNMFLCASENGVYLYNVDPLMLMLKLDFSLVGGVAIAETYKRCQFIAIVGGGEKPRFAENTVLTWNEKFKEFKDQFTFRTPVTAVKMRNDKIFVAEKHVIHAFSFPSECKKLFSLDSGDNSKGILEVSPLYTAERQVIICPGHRAGSVMIYDMNAIRPNASSTPISINAHKSELACISLNINGTLVATASKKGTLIRVFDTLRQTKIVELRRGVDPATLYCLNFSLDSEFLCASSDKGTVHIFALKDTNLNKRSKFSNMGIPNTYVNSQWALANFTVAAECACICAFGSKYNVYAICVDGTYHKYAFNLDGTCVREKYDEFLGLKENDCYDNFIKSRN